MADFGEKGLLSGGGMADGEVDLTEWFTSHFPQQEAAIVVTVSFLPSKGDTSGCTTERI